MKPFLLLLLICLTIGSCNNSENSSKNPQIKETQFQKLSKIVDHYAENTLAKNHINALAIGIYSEGDIYHNYYGEIDAGKSNTPNDSTLFEIASITKTFTGALIAKAVLNNKISLDDDIRDYLEGDYSNLEFEGQPITIKHLLTHSLGLKEKRTQGMKDFNEIVKNGSYDPQKQYYNITNLLEDLKNEPFSNKPGTTYLYSAIGPELLAYILEVVNGTSFKSQLQVFFSELGMENTHLQEYHLHTKNLANGYQGDTQVHHDVNPILGGAGGAISTLPDMIKYMQFLLESNEPWVQEVSKTLFESDDEDTVGYLWENIGIAEEEGFFYSKTGTANGVQSGLLLCPGSTYGLILIGNNTSDEALNDWFPLFFTDIESDLIKFPRLNLISDLNLKYPENPKKVFQEFQTLKTDTLNYFTSANSLNKFGYQLLNNKQHEEAIDVFKFATEKYPSIGNLFDSLGEAYFIAEDFENSKTNFLKALELNPNNAHAKEYLKKIESKL